VQGALEKALRVLFKRRVATVAAGRTDAGVHAEGQVATFPAPAPFRGDLRAALNAVLPPDAAVLSAEEAPGAHARRDALAKTYRYTLLNRSARGALHRARVHWVARPLDVSAMAREARRWEGRRDFAAFGDPPAPGAGTLCRLSRLSVRREGDLIHVEMTADRFLKHMARRLAGRLVQAGLRAESVKPLTLPPQGLTLVSVRVRGSKTKDFLASQDKGR
jgi:tRNA pseudouridine38-40 synthase